MTSLKRSAIGLAVVLALLVSATVAAPASNSSKVSSPTEALTLTDDSSHPPSEANAEDETLCNSQATEVDCNQTEYSEYMQCVEMKRTIRKKRQAICPNANLSNSAGVNVVGVPNVAPTEADVSVLSNCEFERQKCVVGCQGDATCALGCPTTCADSSVDGGADPSCLAEYHSCVANCSPGQPCDTTCKSLCPGAFRPIGYKTVIFQGHDGDEQERVQVPIGIGHNITTIIRLNNYINTTNHINVPTNINNTNLNTVHIYSNKTEGGAFGLGLTKEGDCCFAVQPKSCRTSTSGLRCHHRRHKTCGHQCTSRIIHAQTQKTCNRRGKCSAKVTYVPEPTPNCHYTHQWPYVSCGGQQTRSRNCNGCYDHYGSDHQQPSVPARCMACYDDGYDMGPLYRQGPVYRPSYYHQPQPPPPPPYYMSAPGYSYGYYPPPPPPPMYAPQMYPNYAQGQEDAYPSEESYPSDDMFPGDDEYSGHEPTEETRFNEEEWEQVVQKCKVINVDDNTVIIKNCTMADLGDNPYAASRVSADTEKENSMASGKVDMAAGAVDEERMMAPYPYQYPPYNPYYNYPPPNAMYYGGAPPPAYNYYPPYGMPAAQLATGHSARARNGASAVHNHYGADIVEGDTTQSEDDDVWPQDEEDLFGKGFEKVEEVDM